MSDACMYASLTFIEQKCSGNRSYDMTFRCWHDFLCLRCRTSSRLRNYVAPTNQTTHQTITRVRMCMPRLVVNDRTCKRKNRLVWLMSTFLQPDVEWNLTSRIVNGVWCNFNKFTERVSVVKPHPHQQQCRSNIVDRYKSNDFLIKSNVASTLLPFWQQCRT